MNRDGDTMCADNKTLPIIIEKKLDTHSICKYVLFFTRRRTRVVQERLNRKGLIVRKKDQKIAKKYPAPGYYGTPITAFREEEFLPPVVGSNFSKTRRL